MTSYLISPGQDWEFLVASTHHAEFLSECAPAAPGAAPTEYRVEPSAPLFPHIATLLFVLHLVYEVGGNVRW